MFHLRVFATFFRNSLIREMMFQGNFLIQIITRAFWFFAQIALFKVIFEKVPSINRWTQDKYFAVVSLLAAIVGRAIARGVFKWSLNHYRSASS